MDAKLGRNCVIGVASLHVSVRIHTTFTRELGPITNKTRFVTVVIITLQKRIVRMGIRSLVTMSMSFRQLARASAALALG